MPSSISRFQGHIQSSTGKHHQRLGANGNLLGLELGDAAEGLRVEVELQHVEHLVVEGTGEGDGMGPLLAAGAEEDERRVVLLGEEGQGAGILEGMDGVLLVEALGVGLAQGVEILHGILGLRRTVLETVVYEMIWRRRHTTWLHWVPRRKRAVLGFSLSLGARFSSALLERAVRGLL